MTRVIQAGADDRCRAGVCPRQAQRQPPLQQQHLFTSSRSSRSRRPLGPPGGPAALRASLSSGKKQRAVVTQSSVGLALDDERPHRRAGGRVSVRLVLPHPPCLLGTL